MHFKFRNIQKIVGGFFLLTCIIIVILLVLVARGQRWFQEYIPYSCYFTNGGELNPGSPVIIQGLESGYVKALSLDKDNRVRIDVNIFNQYKKNITEKSEAKIIKPIVGSNKLVISLSSEDAPIIPPKGTIHSNEEESADLDSLVATTSQLVKKLESDDGDLMQSLSNIKTSTKEFSTALSKKDSTLKMLMERRDLYDEMASSAKHLENLLTIIDDTSPDIRDSVLEARRGLEEANKVIMALQKTIFIRGNVEKYLKEDSTLRSGGRAD